MGRAIITLTTDFGTADGFAGALKGVVLATCADAVVVDITHDVPPHDVGHAAFVLGGVHRYFPPDTIHVCVVDPGVGTARRPLLVATPSGRFLAPDNGVLTYVLRAFGTVPPAGPEGPGQQSPFLGPVTCAVPRGCSAFVLDRPELWLHPVSDTFHGRDVFAPVAGHLATGVSHQQLGRPVDHLVYLHVPEPVRSGDTVEGRIIHVDHFGNLISNVQGDLAQSRRCQIDIGGRSIRGLSRSYAEGDALVAVIGSHGYLEVAARNGSAAKVLQVGVGAGVKVQLKGASPR